MKNIASRSKPSEDGAVDLSNKTIRKQEFGRRLYQQLLSQQINQSELARRSGLGRDSISQYVRGRSVPTPQNLEKIAEALQIEPDDLFPNYSIQERSVNFTEFYCQFGDDFIKILKENIDPLKNKFTIIEL